MATKYPLTPTHPVVENPDSVTHWSCPSAPPGYRTHHLNASGRCAYCHHTLTELEAAQRIALKPEYPTWQKVGVGHWESEEQEGGTPDYIATKDRNGWHLKHRVTQQWVAGFRTITEVQEYVKAQNR